MDDATLRRELEQHHRESFGWALACCRRDVEEAETVLQECYLKVLDGRARYDGRASFKTWLFAVIRRTALDQWRFRLLRRLRLTNDAGLAERPASQRAPDDSVYHSELQALFQRELEQLPARQREALQLVFYHELSISECAEVMAVSVGSARTHYERGKKKLKEVMRGWGFGNESGLRRAEDKSVVPTVEAS